MKPFSFMLLNVSNHPYETWPDKQKHDANLYYGGVIDMPFPHIDPNWTAEELKEFMYAFVETIQLKQPQAVYIVGEHVATYILVRLLQKAGIVCLNARSERIVVKHHDGTESKRFNYHGFRAYPIIE